MYLDVIEICMELDENLFYKYNDLLSTNKKKTFNLDYYDNLPCNNEDYSF